MAVFNIDINKIKEKLTLNSFSSEEERETVLRKLINTCSPKTLETINKFQNHWDGSKSFEEFSIAQNYVILKCLVIEQSDLGTMYRKLFNIHPAALENNYEVI